MRKIIIKNTKREGKRYYTKETNLQNIHQRLPQDIIVRNSDDDDSNDGNDWWENDTVII